jgi:hypothetical protein
MTGSAVPRRYLVALIDAGGTVPPALGLAAELVRRGHAVHVLSDPTVEASARAAGCTYSPWREAPHFDSREEQTALIGSFESGNLRVCLLLADGPSEASARLNEEPGVTRNLSVRPIGLDLVGASPLGSSRRWSCDLRAAC